MAGEIAVKGKDSLLSLHDGSAFVALEKQNEGTLSPGVTASSVKHKNGQTPVRTEAGMSFTTSFTKTRPLFPGQQLAYAAARTGDLVQVQVADAKPGGEIWTGLAQIVTGDETSGTSGETVDVPVTVTFDGEPVLTYTPVA
ncbi:phage tail tube protein [Oceanicella sp. SM1341]|uniref:phage tail tube protein n=1 Tax=Oceanicella sp. SM1341 TaxID=1548889 RepID=UPI000E512089|nr:phage tail tube protein [Oceanicella sp. SM1341]